METIHTDDATRTGDIVKAAFAKMARKAPPRPGRKVTLEVECTTRLQICCGAKVRYGKNRLTVYAEDVPRFHALVERADDEQAGEVEAAYKAFERDLDKWKDKGGTEATYPGSPEMFFTRQLGRPRRPFTSVEIVAGDPAAIVESSPEEAKGFLASILELTGAKSLAEAKARFAAVVGEKMGRGEASPPVATTAGSSPSPGPTPAESDEEDGEEGDDGNLPRSLEEALALPAEEAISVLEAMPLESLDALRAWRKAEAEGKNRITILRAADKRIDELTAETSGEG